MAVAALLGITVPASPVSAAQLELTVDAAVVSGLAAGGEAAVLAVWRERVLDAATRVTRIHEVVVDDDGDGVARLELGRPVPEASLWIVVDLATGDTEMAAPGAFRLRELKADTRAFRKNLDSIAVDRTDLEILAVRPGVGAWSLSLSDGGDLDGDGMTDGRAVAALADLTPLGRTATSSPAGLETGDVVAAIDVRNLELLAVRIAQ